MIIQSVMKVLIGVELFWFLYIAITEMSRFAQKLEFS